MPEITAEEIAIYEKFKDDPDFKLMPIPRHWYAHFKIPIPDAATPKQFMEDQYYLKNAISEKDGYEIYSEPQQGGRLVDVAPPEKIECKVVQRPLEMPDNPIEPIKFLPPVLDE
jgi:hypothetical protein